MWQRIILAALRAAALVLDLGSAPVLRAMMAIILDRVSALCPSVISSKAWAFDEMDSAYSVWFVGFMFVLFRHAVRVGACGIGMNASRVVSD